MDIDNNEENKVKNTIYCTHCGALNDIENKFCTSCGTPMDLDSPIEQPLVENNQPTPKTQEKKTSNLLLIILGIASVALAFFLNELILFVFLAAFISLFFKKARPYGLSVIITTGVVFIVGLIIILLLVGMCFAGLR